MKLQDDIPIRELRVVLKTALNKVREISWAQEREDYALSDVHAIQIMSTRAVTREQFQSKLMDWSIGRA